MSRRKESIDLSTLRYVLYARKSTEDEGSQMRSIKDQISDCMRLAEREHLNIVEVLEEKKSAKNPNRRPIFSQLLKDIEAKKFDAILCWHPDRLSRNMLESGKIIDMLDNTVIKDLRFVSHQFSNDANGKMLLGMLFVFSKQYSEDLAEKVQRGLDHNLSEGKSAGIPKWGYERSTDGLYIPDSNFDYIKAGWQMRVEGTSISDILRYWKMHDVHRMTKINRKNRVSRKITLTKTGATRLFSDPFYYGILEQSDQEVDLRTIYKFTPMIDEQTYDKVLAISRNRSRLKPKARKRDIFYPFRGMVLCGVCNSDRPMRVGKNKSGSGTYYLTYRCDNPTCTRKVKSVRAHYVLDDLYEALDKLKFTDKEYDLYSKRLEERTEEKIVALRTELHNLKGQKTHKQQEFDQKARQLGEIGKRSPAYGVLERDLEDLQDEIIDIDEETQKLSAKIVDPGKIKLAKDEFLNLANSAADKMRAGLPVEKDALARILLLNLSINDEMAPSYRWKEPFASLIEARSVQLGAPHRPVVEPH